MMQFYKYQGAGNDFVLIDNRDGSFDGSQRDYIEHLCDRRFGIGADGLMLLQRADGYDFEMVYFNADGLLGSMCGNGGRCIVAFARDLGLIRDTTRFIAVDGPHEATLHQDGKWISLKMADVKKIEQVGHDFVLNTGSPHYVKVVQDLQDLDVYTEGRAIRYNDEYKSEGINVNFVEVQVEGYAVRTYERGVEDETLACGTGVTAVALAMAYKKRQEGYIETPIKAKGGDLRIRFRHIDGNFDQIFLEGPAARVFEGHIVLR